LLGEDLGPLNIKELQNLEKQLEGALAQARQRKVPSNYHNNPLYIFFYPLISTSDTFKDTKFGLVVRGLVVC
jgi:hypothetical protein